MTIGSRVGTRGEYLSPINLTCANSIQYHRAQLAVWLTLLLLPIQFIEVWNIRYLLFEKAIDEAIIREQRPLAVSTCIPVIDIISNIPR